MKIYFLLIAFTLNYISLRGQESILKFEPNKKYELYFIDVVVREYDLENFDSIPNATVRWDRNRSFLIDDELTLNNLQTTWTGERTNEFYFCWYNYFIYVVEDGKIVDELRVNEDCRHVVSKDGVFNYSTTITDKLSKSKVVSVARIRFDSLALGRQFYMDIRNDRKIFAPAGDYDEWLKYDGEVRINAKVGNPKKTQARMERDLKKQFPREAFEIHQSGSGPDFDIYCSKNVGENLKGYKIWLRWTELTLSPITLFTTTAASIENILEKYSH
jgi:hypothetical protein